jgi:salicylate hydroxylase
MLPHLGAGAGQAIEDAHLLTQLLTHPSTNLFNVEVRLRQVRVLFPNSNLRTSQLVMQAYDMVRRPRANRVLQASSATGEIYELAGPSGPTLEGARKDLEGIWEFVWRHDLDEDFRTSVKFLEEKQAFKV